MISTYLEVIAVSLREIAETSRKVTNLRAWSCPETTGDPSSKYEHRRASALLHNIQNIRICKRKKIYRFCNLRKWKDFNKKQLTLLKMCVTSLLCGPRADLWPFYGCLCKRFSLYISLGNGHRPEVKFSRANLLGMRKVAKTSCSLRRRRNSGRFAVVAKT